MNTYRTIAGAAVGLGLALHRWGARRRLGLALRILRAPVPGHLPARLERLHGANLVRIAHDRSRFGLAHHRRQPWVIPGTTGGRPVAQGTALSNVLELSVGTTTTTGIPPTSVPVRSRLSRSGP